MHECSMHVCILAEGYVDQRKNCAYVSQVAQVSDTAKVTREVPLLGLIAVRTRQEISKHISITYNMLYWTRCIFVV